MKNILSIIKKEFARFFKDRRLVLTTLFLPGIMIYALYSIMGDAIVNNFESSTGYEYQIYTNEIPTVIEEALGKSELLIKKISYLDSEIPTIKEKIANKECDLLLIFPKNFEQVIKDYDSLSGEIAPNVLIYYNSVSVESSYIYNIITAILNEYESLFTNKFDINNSNDVFDLATNKDLTGMIFSMMLPFLIMTFLFSGCMSIAPESIAGEKERGTIATLLITPIKRSELAIGKIISLSCIAILSSLSSFLGTILSLPNLMKMSGGEMPGGISGGVYTLSDYFAILLVIISTVMLIIGLMAILSAFAKSVKEANTIISPLMILVMVIGITSMFGSTTQKSILYLIPFYNSVQVMGSIFSFESNLTNILIAVGSNLAYSFLLVYILTKVFKNEKIMFSN